MFVVGRRLVGGSALVLLASLIIGAQVARASDGTTSWSQVTGQSAFTGVNLRDVTCPTANHCVAVGYSGNGEAILVGDNGTWTAQSPAQLSQNFGALNSVSCIDASNCVAVGYYTTGGNSFNTYHPLIEAWNGSTWSLVSAPGVGDTYNFLFSVDCTGGSPNQCTTVGYWSNTFGNDRSQHPLVLQGNDANGWSFSVVSPNPGVAGDSLQAVRCPTSTSCIAVGHGGTGGLAIQGTETNGTWDWSTRTTDSTGGALAGLDCTSATFCIAVGTQGFPERTLAETWNGSGAFTPISSPDPGGYTSAFSDISCVSATNCSAVGNTTPDRASPSTPLVEQWDGANWWQVTAPSSGPGSAALYGVTCVPASNTCVGVGTDTADALVDTGAGYTPPPSHTLTVTRTGSASDRVSDNTGAISCPTTCAHAYPEGTVVTLTATPGSGSKFAGWSGGGCSGTGTCQVTLNSDTTVSAAFTATAAGSPPSATTSESTPTGSTKASFAGLANPNGLPTSVRFQYGLDRRYRAPGYTGSIFDQLTPARSIGSGTSATKVTMSVGGLVPNALYHVRLLATNGRGTTVGSDLTFRTAKDGPPPRPVLGKSEDASPVSGIVFFVQNGKLVPLTEGRRLPNGTVIDALYGSLKLVTSTGKKGKTYFGTFGGAVFRVTQARSGLTTLTLVEGRFGVPSYASCKAKGASEPVAGAALSSRVLQTLRSSSRGRFRTRGRFAAGTVRGTRWTTRDRCDGTWIAVQLHSVLVTDFVKHITVLVHQGQHYLAHAPKK